MGYKSSTLKVVKIGAGVVAGVAGDAAVSVIETVAYNGVSGAPLGTGLGAAAIGGCWKNTFNNEGNSLAAYPIKTEF